MNPVNPNDRKKSGSLKDSEPEFLLAGKLLKPHGLKGEMWLKIITDFPNLFYKGGSIFIGENFKKFIIESVKQAGEKVLISFEELTDVEQVRELVNMNVYFSTNQLPELENGFFHHHQIIGLTVKYIDGEIIGKIIDIIQTGANDIYVVRPLDQKNDDILIPAIESIIDEVNLDKGIMVIHKLDWYD